MRSLDERSCFQPSQMLAFARHERLEPRVVDLSDLLPGLEGMLRHAVGPRVTLAFDIAAGVWPLLADPHQLEVALLNLAVNARDAMPDGGRLTLGARNLPAEVRGTSGFAAGDRVEIRVVDSGTGMTEATLARAFEPFFTTKEAGKGTGLGFAQVHGLVQASGGTVRIESALGTGTAVFLALPRSAILAGDRPEGDGLASDRHGGATILLVDDDDQVRPVTGLLLRDLGYTVVEAPSAAVALAQLHPVDLLLTDVVMRGTDGPALARSLRSERPDLPVVFITGYAAGHDLDGETVVAKPFGEEELGRRVLEALGRLDAPPPRRAVRDDLVPEPG